MEDKEEQKISKYSSGVNILIRIDGLWKKTHLYAEAGRYMLWNTVLDIIWLELARDIKVDDYATKETDFNVFETGLKELMPFSDDKPSGFREPSPEDIERRNKVYILLKKKQLFLARLENKMGKGTTFDEEDDDDFD